MSTLIRIGQFVRIVDEDGVSLSLTNLACYVALIKVAIAPGASMADLGVLLVSLLNYAHRRHVGSNAPDPVVLPNAGPITADLESLKSKVNALMMSGGVREMKKP